MTTTVLQKTEVKPTWKLEQVQELNTHIMADMMMSAMEVLGKHGDEAREEFQALTRKEQVSYYKGLGVKTPLELIKAKAELETNLYGSVIEFSGNETEATLVYKSCAVWNAMQKRGLDKQQEEKMGECFQACVQNFAKEFGFTGEVKFDGTCATLIIRK